MQAAPSWRFPITWSGTSPRDSAIARAFWPNGSASFGCPFIQRLWHMKTDTWPRRGRSCSDLARPSASWRWLKIRSNSPSGRSDVLAVGPSRGRKATGPEPVADRLAGKPGLGEMVGDDLGQAGGHRREPLD